jgi:tRNA pseudouridine55 synthase
MLKTKIVRRALHGVLLLDKPLGLSSNDALQKAKWLLRAEKAGHTGTLDPMATGLLPLCFGAATKFSQGVLDADKTYLARVVLGVTTTTEDSEGEVVTQQPANATDAEIEAVLARFRGPIAQIPPMYSALKRDGKPLYAYARAGVALDLEPRHVHIHRLERQDFIGEDIFEKNRHIAGISAQFVAIDLIVTCSKGTYIRSLARDIGAALGCGAHLGGLRRTQTAGFDLAQAVTLERLQDMADAEREAVLLPTAALLGPAPRVALVASEAARFLSGLRRRTANADEPLVAVYGPATTESGCAAFLGSAHIKAGELIPTRLLSPVEVGASQTQTATLSPTKALS